MMKHILKAFLSLGRRGQHNIVKILCLGIGLAVGAVLIGKVGFEQSWDNFFPASKRIYVVCEDIIRDGEYKNYPQTAGAVAPGLKRYCPQVEAATRYTEFAMQAPVLTEDGKRVRTTLSLADSCFFDVFPFQVLHGNARKVLSQSDYCMIPRSLAEQLGGNMVGRKIYLNRLDGLALTVGGVYEDIPLNSVLAYQKVLVAMPTITKITWDGRENWTGNDRYHSYVRLAEGVTPDDLKPQVEKMKQENLPQEELKKAGVELGFSLKSLYGFHKNDEGTRRMSWILTLLAVVLIGCAVMNYLLFVVGGISQRAREMAVHKCYGAERRHIYNIVCAESFVHLLLSVALAALVLFLTRDMVAELVGQPLTVLLTTGHNMQLLAVAGIAVFALTGLVPSWLYTRIPVAAAFKHYGQAHRLWKLGLLAVQFASATLLITLLVIVARQYRLMVSDNPGYDYSTLAIIQEDGVTAQQRQLLVDELRKLSSVEGVTTAYTMLTDYQSGDNIYLPNDDHEYMNIADLFFTSDGYFDVMGIPVLSGRTFTEQTDTLREVMVSQRFEERMRQLAGWTDGAVGKQIICTSFEGPYTIVGVYADPRIGSISMPDVRPSVCFYSRQLAYTPIIIIRFHSMDGLEEANKTVRELVPDHPDISVYPYTLIMTNLYTDAHHFRSTVLIGGLVALLIALIGLVGYLAGEVSRRQKEIAIRKVNGARVREVLALFLHDILRVAVPAVAAGAVGAWLIARLWLQQFSERTALAPGLFLGSALLVLAVILAVVTLACWRVAAGNPARYLKSE